MGIPLMRTKTWAYAMGAFFGGLAGAYYASFKSSTFPQDFYFNISVFILCMVILGGMGNVWGVLLGAAFLEYLNQEGLANIGAWLNLNLGTHIDVPGVPGRDLRSADRASIMLLRPAGPAPERAPEARAPVRRRTTSTCTTSERTTRPSTSEAPGDLMAATCSKPGRMRKEFGGLVAVSDIDLHDPGGCDRQPDRPERRRQDDVLQHDHRRLQADGRAGRRSTARTSRASRRTRSPSAGSAGRSRTSASSRT